LNILLNVSICLQIGNKRLKVQHKQIRPSDQQHERGHGNNNNYGYDNMAGPQGGPQGGGYGRGHISPSLPPSGPMAMNSAWYNNRPAPSGPVESSTPGEPQQQEEGIGANTNAGAPADNNSGAGPLSSMEPLLQNLPDVGGDGDQLK
jgi:hypothetical protein